MKSSYKPIGNYVQQSSLRNKDNIAEEPQGVNINKEFMPSVANTLGTDLSKYRVVKKNQFAFNPMHVGRDEVLPIAMLSEDESIIVSPAYVVFAIKDHEELLPEYLMMWMRRSEFDREAWFTTDSSVRGGFSWSDFCAMQLPVPHIDKQREIVKEYNTIVNRIALNEELNRKLEETAQAIYKQWFVDFEFPVSKEYAAEIGKPELEGKPYKSSGGEMDWNEELEKEIPVGWGVDELGNKCSLVTKGTTPPQMFTSYREGLIPFIKGESMNEFHAIDEKILSYVDEETHNGFLKRSIIVENDILFSIAGTLGKFSLVTDRILPANTNQAVAIIRVKESLIPRTYILGLLLSGWHTVFYAENIQQAVQANLSLTTIKALPILVPDEATLVVAENIIEKCVTFLQNSNDEIQLLKQLEATVLSKMTKVGE